MPYPINTSTCRNFDTTSSGLDHFLDTLIPQFGFHNTGPMHIGKIKLVDTAYTIARKRVRKMRVKIKESTAFTGRLNTKTKRPTCQ